MTPALRPRFRTDLVAEPIQEDGKRFIDVFDPDSGAGYRFYEVEYSLACAMDGERDVAGLVRWAREELGVEPSPRELTTVISTLGDLGYLAGERGPDVGVLAAGVVTGPTPVAPRVEDVELGTAGGAAPQPIADVPSADVELGQAGGVSAPRIVVNEFGTGPELGPAGRDDFPPPPSAAVPVAQLRPTTSPDSDTDGPTDLPRPVPLAGGDEDVSTDLSDHLAISASDVKEAVRASRVMQAVEIPADIAATIAAAEAENEARAAAERAEQAAAAEKAAAEKAAAAETAAVVAAAKAAADKAAADKLAAEKLAAEAAAKAAADKAAAEKAAQALVEAKKPADKPVETKKPADKAADKPVETKKPTDGKKPADKAADTATAKLPPPKTPVEAPAEAKAGGVLITLLILTILLAGAYLVWTQILKKPLPWEKGKAAATKPLPPAPPAPPPAPPPPPPASSTLTEQAGATTAVGASKAGAIVDIVADGSTIAAGDVLARFAASPALTKQLAAGKKKLEVDLPKAITELTAKRDAATAAGKADVAKTWQDKLDKQVQVQTSLEAEVASLTSQLDAYAVKAPVAGTVKTQVAKGAKVALEQPLAAITGPTKLVAPFTANPGKAYKVGQSVRIAVKATPTQSVNCTVAAADGNAVTVECPSDAGVAGGTEITLE